MLYFSQHMIHTTSDTCFFLSGTDKVFRCEFGLYYCSSKDTHIVLSYTSRLFESYDRHHLPYLFDVPRSVKANNGFLVARFIIPFHPIPPFVHFSAIKIVAQTTMTISPLMTYPLKLWFSTCSAKRMGCCHATRLLEEEAHLSSIHPSVSFVVTL